MTTLAERLAQLTPTPPNPDASDLADIISAIMDMPALADGLNAEDLTLVNDWLNSHPTYGAPASLRSHINQLATREN